MIFSIQKIYVVFILFFASILGACSIETAKAPSSSELVILSDYLLPKDTVLFSQFSKNRNVSVKIIATETDKIVGLMRNNGFNTKGDIIMVKSLLDINRLNQRDILHNIDFSKELVLPEHDQSNWSRNFLAYGYDPFVFANSKYALLNTYADLKRLPFVSNISERNIPVVLSPVIKKFSKMQANTWIKKFARNRISIDSLARINNDSIRLRLPILTTYSDFRINKDSVLNYSHRRLKLSNNSSKGTFYNLRTIAILKHAQNYSEAREFSMFYLKKKNNISLNKKLSTIPIYYPETQFKRYKTNTSELIQYYTTIERILSKLK